jgi:hypothetical protein
MAIRAPQKQLRWGRLIFAFLVLAAIPVAIYVGLIRH